MSEEMGVAGSEATTSTATAKKKMPKPSKADVKLCADGHEMCDACGECHECEEIAEKAARKAAEPQTQKAKGLRVLQRCGWRAPAVSIVMGEDQLKNAFIRARSAVGDAKKPVFARPCPVRPRHGFVESRPVMTQDEAMVVFKEARAADPDAEMMLSPFLQSSHNMLWRPGLLAVGPLHDGATAGKDSIGIPLLRLAKGMEVMEPLCKEASIADGEDPYVEAVFGMADSICYFTQLRSGARVNGVSENYIPDVRVVQEVVMAEGDLLEWEAKAETLKGNMGVAVWHPGGTLASHFSVHCIQRQIPILITKEPKVGETIEPEGDVVPPPAVDAVMSGLASGLLVSMEKKSREHIVCSILTGLHHSAALGGEKGFFIGVSAAAMIRLGYAAAIGESRHSQASPVKSGKTMFGVELSRSQIYEKALTNSIFKSRELVPAVLSLFFTRGAFTSSGYGGPKWGECTKATAQLDNAIITFLKAPDADGVTKVVSALNNAVHQVHNNGWWLNKFAETTLADRAATGDPKTIIPAGVFFYDAWKASHVDLRPLIAEWASQSPIPVEQIRAKVDKINPEMIEKVVVKAAAQTAATASTGGTKKWAVPAGAKVLKAQAKKTGASSCHIQFTVADFAAYKTVDLTYPTDVTHADLTSGEKVISMAGGDTPYYKIDVVQKGKAVVFKTANGKTLHTLTL